MTPAVVLLALLCPVGAGEADCTVDNAQVVISHEAPPGTPCETALTALLMEAAVSPIQGGKDLAWRFTCVRR